MKKLIRVFAKALGIAAFLAGIILALGAFGKLGSATLYNRVWRGRERFPFGENPRTAYNFSLSNLDALFAAHEISGAGEKDADAIRIVVIGDSSVWGTLLKPEETLAAQLNGKTIRTAGTARVLEVYNLGYPTLSLSKDLLILNRALKFNPDLVIWSMTFESFPVDKQLTTALVADNLDEFYRLNERVALPSVAAEISAANPTHFSFNKLRRDLFDLIRLQLYGFLWSATGVDQDYPLDYPRPQLDFAADDSFHGVSGAYPPALQSWDVLDAGETLADGTPILFLNEPMVISSGKNKNIRYNFYYPRDAYDAWRAEWLTSCDIKERRCLDTWDLLTNNRFTNSAIHYDAIGASVLSQVIMDELELLFEANE